MPVVCPGGMLKLRFDRYIMLHEPRLVLSAAKSFFEAHYSLSSVAQLANLPLLVISMDRLGKYVTANFSALNYL